MNLEPLTVNCLGNDCELFGGSLKGSHGDGMVIPSFPAEHLQDDVHPESREKERAYEYEVNMKRWFGLVVWRCSSVVSHLLFKNQGLKSKSKPHQLGKKE